MLPRLVVKAKIQLEDIICKKSFQGTLQVAFTIANRRKIPLPAALYSYFTKPTELAEDMGSERFLEGFMVPEQGTCFVDVGANVGEWTLFVAQRKREVYAFEPSPKAYPVLVERTKNCPNVHPYLYALADEDTTGRIGLSAFSLSGTMYVENDGLPGGKTINIPVYKLDSLPLPKVGVIKIDTEGYETPILRGAKSTIRKDKPRLIIEVHQGTGKAAATYNEELQKIKNILSELGYNWIVDYRPITLHEMQPFIIANKASNPSSFFIV